MSHRRDEAGIGAGHSSATLSQQSPARSPSSAIAGSVQALLKATFDRSSRSFEPRTTERLGAFHQKLHLRFFAIIFIVMTFTSTIVRAQVYPAAPHSPTSWDLVDGTSTGARAGFVRVPAGNNGPVDSFGYCRWVTNSNARENVVPVSTATEWQYFRAGEFNGSAPPGITEVVCCRPQTVSLCGGAIQKTLPYTAYQGTQSYTQNCGAYTETQSWTCNSTLPATPNAVFADGAWQESADTNVQNCTANWQSVYQGCTAGCNQYGSYQYYNYDANACPGDNAYTSYSGSCYGGACCQPSYSCSGCNQGTGQKTCTDVACGTGSYQQACSLVNYTCSSSCQLGSGSTTIFWTNGPGDYCNTIYHDCAYWSGTTAGGTACNYQYNMEYATITCTGAGSSPNVQAGMVLTGASCTCSTYQ